VSAPFGVGFVVAAVYHFTVRRELAAVVRGPRTPIAIAG
jgi:hypothetical protein